MTAYKVQTVSSLHDPVTGALVGLMGIDGKEYVFPLVTGPTVPVVTVAAGNQTSNSLRGRGAVAAAAVNVTITNNLVTVNSQIILTIEGAGDTTFKSFSGLTIANGSFTAICNAATTANSAFSWIVVN